MYGHNNINELSYSVPADFLCHFPLTETTPPPPTTFTSAPLPPLLVIPGNELDSVSALKSEIGCYSTSSGCSSYGSPSSFTSYSTSHLQPSLIQRSVSSHSLFKNSNVFGQQISSPIQYFDSETSPVRRVFSTGDLHRINGVQPNKQQASESPLSTESSIIESMTAKACRYSPEEKKERIERYRSKRSLRNFNKKIKYACRKTLADSRPRIRGRFARNGEIEKTPESDQWSHLSGEEINEEEDDNWISFLDSFSANLIP